MNDTVATVAATPASDTNKSLSLTGKNLAKIQPMLEAELVKLKEVPISFKTQEEIDEAGKKTGIKSKREGWKAVIPEITFTGLLESLKDPKQQDFILSLANDAIYAQYRAQVSDNPTWKNQDEVDLGQLTLEYISNLPAGERRGGGIAKETWDEFVRDYVAVMTVLQSDKDPSKITNAATIFAKRLQPVKTNKQVLPVLQTYLGTWFQNSEKKEDFQDVFEFLVTKITDFLQKDDSQLLDSL